MKPLNECLRKKMFQWTDEEQKAFQSIKNEFAKGTVLLRLRETN
jgi:hypothetical protein